MLHDPAGPGKVQPWGWAVPVSLPGAASRTPSLLGTALELHENGNCCCSHALKRDRDRQGLHPAPPAHSQGTFWGVGVPRAQWGQDQGRLPKGGSGGPASPPPCPVHGPAPAPEIPEIPVIPTLQIHHKPQLQSQQGPPGSLSPPSGPHPWQGCGNPGNEKGNQKVEGHRITECQTGLGWEGD